MPERIGIATSGKITIAMSAGRMQRMSGTVIFTHPLENKFDAVHHPSYIELFSRLAQTRDQGKHYDDL